MSKRQSPIVRAGSGDSHEARIAVLEQRFSEDMQARCSWCNQVKSAKHGEWLEVIISTPGTGVRPAHVFRCLGCEGPSASMSGGIVAVPSGARRPGESPPPSPAPASMRRSSGQIPAKTQSSAASAEASGPAEGRPRGRGRPRKHRPGERTDRAGSSPARDAGRRPESPVFGGRLSPAP